MQILRCVRDDSVFPTCQCTPSAILWKIDDGILNACTWHCVAGAVEFENTNDNSCTLRQTRVKNVAEGRRRNRWEIQREAFEEAKREDRERCCVLKGDIPWMIFYSWPSSPSATSTSSRSSQSRWCRSCRIAVSSASKRGSRPGLMDFTTPWGPLNPHSPSPLTSLSFQPPRAFPHTFSRFHVSAHVRRSKCAFLRLRIRPTAKFSSLLPRVTGPLAKMYWFLTNANEQENVEKMNSISK